MPSHLRPPLWEEKTNHPYADCGRCSLKWIDAVWQSTRQLCSSPLYVHSSVLSIHHLTQRCGAWTWLGQRRSIDLMSLNDLLSLLLLLRSWLQVWTNHRQAPEWTEPGTGALLWPFTFPHKTISGTDQIGSVDQRWRTNAASNASSSNPESKDPED